MSEPAEPGAERAAQLLAAVLESSPRRPTELAEIIGMPPVELEPLIAALERHDLVDWDSAHSELRPGPAALRFARSGVGRQDLLDLSLPGLRRVAEESGETTNLILPRPAGTEAVVQVDGRHLLGATNWVGRELGLHCTAAGKVFLAFGVAELPGGKLEPTTPATVTDRAALARELEAVRGQGYATIVDELEPGLSAVAAPVRDRDGTVVAALSAAGASLRLAPQRLRLLGRVALEQAQAISSRLGYDAPPDEHLGSRAGLGIKP